MRRAIHFGFLLFLASACSRAVPVHWDVSVPEAARAPASEPAAAHPAPPDPRGEALGRAIDALRQKDGIVGLSIAVVDHDDVVLLRGFGTQDLEGTVPITPDTPFPIASITKTFTSVLAAIAVDEHKLSFDQRPRELLPRFHLRDPDADARVTLRDLLAHRTGLAGEAGEIAAGFDGLDLESLLGIVADARPTAKLGAASHYNNACFAIAGAAVARAEGTSYAALLGARILEPLGMRSTALVTSDLAGAEGLLVPGYFGDAHPVADAAGEKHADVRVGARISGWIAPGVQAPGGGLRSTARDMAQWVRLLNGRGASNGRRLVQEETFAELVKPASERSPGEWIGLDFVLGTFRGHRVAYHGGELLGADALLAFLPDDGVGFVMLSNTLAPDTLSDFRGGLIRTVLGAFLPPRPPSPAAPSPASPPTPASPLRAVPTDSPSVDELMARTIAALGGEAAMRRHRSWESIEDVELETQGVTARVRSVAAAPAYWRRDRDIFAAGRRLGTERRWFDGTDTYWADGGRLDEPVRLPPSLTGGAREENDFYRELSWRTLWSSVTLRGVGDVAESRRSSSRSERRRGSS